MTSEVAFSVSDSKRNIIKCPYCMKTFHIYPEFRGTGLYTIYPHDTCLNLANAFPFNPRQVKIKVKFLAKFVRDNITPTARILGGKDDKKFQHVYDKDLEKFLNEFYL